MPSDPLSEARTVLLDVLACAMFDGFGETVQARAERTLARLDALPAPSRLDANDYVPLAGPGWFYPDAPSDGGDDA